MLVIAIAHVYSCAPGPRISYVNQNRVFPCCYSLHCYFLILFHVRAKRFAPKWAWVAG